MSDSLQNINKRCIFRETFESEQAVRRNGGVPTDVTFEKGMVSLLHKKSVLYIVLRKINTVFNIR